MTAQKTGWMKILGVAILIVLLPGAVWFAGNVIEYNKWWDGLPLFGEMKNIDDTGANPVMVFIRRTVRWDGSLLEYREHL